MKTPFVIMMSALVLSINPVSAKEEVPRGFEPLAELKKAQDGAIAGKKLVVLVVKGMDDECPNCAAALANGLDALGSGVVKVFARAETIGQADATSFTPALKERVKKGFTTGAAVTFVVMDPQMNRILVEAGRTELQEDKKATAEFRKKVHEARKSVKS